MSVPTDDYAARVPEHKYRGARAMVILHAREMRQFLRTWERAVAANLVLPATDDPDYQSLDTLLRHVLRAARGYLVWMCEKLDLPDPAIPEAPESAGIGERAAEFIAQVTAKYATVLVEVPEQIFESTHPSRWGTTYSIDAMFEHAVMHPIRHTFQLEELLAAMPA